MEWRLYQRVSWRLLHPIAALLSDISDMPVSQWTASVGRKGSGERSQLFQRPPLSCPPTENLKPWTPFGSNYIRESVDSLCRDDADTLFQLFNFGMVYNIPTSYCILYYHKYGQDTLPSSRASQHKPPYTGKAPNVDCITTFDGILHNVLAHTVQNVHISENMATRPNLLIASFCK